MAFIEESRKRNGDLFTQVIGERWRKVSKRAVEKMHLNEKNAIYQGVRKCIVFLLIDIAWLFFRADNIGCAFSMLRKCATDIHLGDLRIWQRVLYEEEWFIVGSAVLILFLVDYFHEKGYKIRDWLSNRHFVIRWSVYSILTATVMVAATRQMGGDASQFLYIQF